MHDVVDWSGRDYPTSWRGKIVDKFGAAFAELRCRVYHEDTNSCCDVMIVVATEGYTMAGNKSKSENYETTRTIGVRISMNGPCALSFSDMERMNKAIDEAKQRISSLNKKG